MVHLNKDSNAIPCEGILVIVDEMWKSLEDFIEYLPEDVDYTHYEWITKNALNRIRNFFN